MEIIKIHLFSTFKWMGINKEKQVPYSGAYIPDAD